jgi:DNA-binding CsgD family transcriptional regulator
VIGGLLDGPGGGLVIEGEPGIGKTALWSHGVAEAGLRGYRVRACSPTESEAQLSFVALRDLLAGAFGEVEGELPAPQRRALAIALLLEQPDGQPPEPGAIAAGLLSSVRALSRSGPVLLAVDDVQCLDLASARALGFVFRRIRDDEQVSILLAQRADAPADALGLARLLAAGRLMRLWVGPLGLGALHRAIRAGADVWLPRPVMRRVHELSGGNPLFALELARSVKRGEGRLDAVAALSVPDRLLRLVSGRVLELPELTQLALAAAASLSHPTTRLIDRVVDGGADALDAAIGAGVVVGAGGEIAFTHPLLASAAYMTAGPARRRQVHRLFASLVTDPEERARHLALACNPPDAQVADALDRGAVRAFARGAPSAAADLSALAGRFTPSTETQSVRRRALAEAEYALQAGDPDRARGLLEAVVAGSPPGPARAQALTHLARYYLSGVDWRRSAELLWDALAEAGPDPLVRAQCELGLARLLLLLRADMHQVVAHADAATILAEQVGDPTVLGEALAIRVESGFLLGRPAPAELRQRAVELEPRMDAFTAGLPSSYFAYVDLLADEPHSALAAYDDLCRRAAEHGDENSLAWLLLRAALAEISTGEWARADGRIVQAEEILAQTGQSTNQAQSLATKALLHARLGRVESARDAGQQAVELARPTGAAVPRWIALEALGFLDVSLGRPNAAATTLGPLADEVQAASVNEPGELRFLPDLIEALLSCGRGQEATARLSFLERCAQTTGRRSALVATTRCRALQAAAEGDVSGALVALEHALQLYEPLALPFERARTLLVLGVTLRRAKQRRRAREVLHTALAAFERLGAQVWCERTRAELARIAGRAPSPDNLTPAEHRIAGLVAEGKTNREVAAALYLSERTVEGHLSHIYTKLGIRSRAELARMVASKPEFRARGIQ